MPLPIHQSMKDYLTTTEGITSKYLSLPLDKAFLFQTPTLVVTSNPRYKSWSSLATAVLSSITPGQRTMWWWNMHPRNRICISCVYTLGELRLFCRSYYRFFQVGDKILVHLARWSCLVVCLELIFLLVEMHFFTHYRNTAPSMILWSHSRRSFHQRLTCLWKGTVLHFIFQP